jgi:hypothetical protein
MVYSNCYYHDDDDDDDYFRTDDPSGPMRLRDGVVMMIRFGSHNPRIHHSAVEI